jgi:hypothetical protein
MNSGFGMEMSLKMINDKLKKNSVYDPVRSELSFQALKQKLERKKHRAEAIQSFKNRIVAWFHSQRKKNLAGV